VSAILPFVYVGLGSMLGGVSRYGMTLVTQNYAVFSIPFGTLISNIAGCLLIGLIAGIGATSQMLSTEMRLLLATGFCGGFTTMSSFVYELVYRTRSISMPRRILLPPWRVRDWRLFWGF